MLEEMALVERERKLDDLQDDDQDDRQHDHGHRLFEAAGRPLRDRRGQLAQAMRAAGEQQPQQQDAGNRRPQEVGAPAQAMVAGGFVFVQSASSQYPVSGKFWLLLLFWDPMSRRLAMAAAVLTAAWLLAYGPTIAGGFIKDDFGWVYHSRIGGWSSLLSAFTSAQVFYRPMVRLSFGVTEALFGNNPIPYALTNLLLGLACSLSIFALGRATGLASWAALAGTAVWAFNFHGINMAIVWLSGRTSLLGTLFSTLAALAFVRNRAIAAGVLAFGAFLSKEEVLALPVILTIWSIIDKADIKRTAGTWIALAVYFSVAELLRRRRHQQRAAVLPVHVRSGAGGDEHLRICGSIDDACDSRPDRERDRVRRYSETRSR